MEYKTYKNIKIPQNLSPEKQALVDEIARNYAVKNREIEADNLKNMGRIALGSLVSGASFHPILNIPYVGTGLGGAMYDAGQAIVEGDKLGDIAKRAGRGFAIGETVGAVPYVGKGVNKLSGGKIGNAVDAVAEKVAANPAVQKAYDALMTDIKGFNPNKQTVFHGSPYDFEKFSNEAIGTGEGAQAHGMGHYAALNKDVADEYANRLSSKSRRELFYGDKNVKDLPYKTEIAQMHIYGKDNVLNDLLKESNNISNIEDLIEQNKKINYLKNINTNKITEKQNKQLYKLSIPKDDVLLREDATFAEQPKAVQEGLERYFRDTFEGNDFNVQLLKDFLGNSNGAEIYGMLKSKAKNDYRKNPKKYEDVVKKIKQYAVPVNGKNPEIIDLHQVVGKNLNDYGIKGISYNGGIDGEARVIFNPDDIDIVRKYYNQPTLKDYLANDSVLTKGYRINKKAFDDYIKNLHYSPNFKPGYILGNNGKPLTVYHGTDEVFEDFIPKGNSDFADAVYFSDNKNVAKTYTHTNNIKERYLDLDNPLEVDANGRTYNEYYDQLRSDFNQALNNNNDGIIVKNIIDDNLQKEGLGKLSNEYIVFNPSKIKKREELNKKMR